MKHDFRKPVFVRNDDHSELEVGVVVWDAKIGGKSIRFNDNNHSVLVDVQDWERIKAAIECELNRIGD